MGLVSKDDGWHISEALWQRMEPLLLPRKPTRWGTTTRAFPTGR